MALLIAGLVGFLGIHSTRITAHGFRASMVERFGPNGWRGIYSIVSILAFIALIYGYGMARENAGQLYIPESWGRTVALLVMPIAFILLAASQLPRGHIKRLVGHPMLWGVLLWSAAHLTANGDTASVILFGSFLVWAAIDLVSCYRRPVGDLPDAKIWPDLVSVVGGLVLTVLFVSFLHEWIVGVGIV
ncbi:NnrU family protein [Pseudahrensia aquimaris]|uniref:NnrU family protein n=1 Tax=Pseudahrensia aquimaris TaxID=744461 RepID=A0ABW3FDL4_9HYPH